ncbi:mandelate racemase/muconate lactonizing enzyme family protein [Petroclostridium sp. X23]|jgi:L-alanine-DL-glutamate epimerase-like enolase superfamily enzyme|uniref:mandelate racemase/muconate lactonizing enzyme family protein n=1 Tax=Petroclostridium sp. X23 TaxID=3045146 RepID=UPI0024AE48F5|nr:mandelate racemase/muconate lactonizing enzyme family protein [Petroclostridium sp. X23]WHH57680.1 mandelate racemase/muconate lactonizing enzyme family protein [Petroclostridium sp. X23]
MKITKVEAIPVKQKGDILLINDSAQDGIIIKVYTDEGIVGYGEVDSAPWVIKAIIDSPASHRICQGLGQAIIGEDPFETDKIWEKMYLASMFYGRRGAVIHAISGIDIAIWDIIGKALNKPIYKLLGGEFRSKVRAYASTLMPYTPEESAEEALKWKEKGFTAVKMGWGGFELGFRENVELVRAAREAIGEDMDLMLDLGFIPSPDTPIDATSRLLLAKEIRQFSPYWIEEPLSPDDYDGYKMLAESIDTRIAGGENESTRYGFKQLIDYSKINIIQPDITRCGGLTEAKKIATMAMANNITTVPHAWSSGIVIAASLHLIAAIPNACLLEYCVWDTPIRKEMLIEDFIVKDGYVDVPQKPGLGIEIDDKAIEKYRADKY